MTILILQARLDSTRLVRKALLELANAYTLLDAVLDQLAYIEADHRILACPEDSASSFASSAGRAGWLLHAGPKEDVLGRFAGALRHFVLPDSPALEDTLVLRATGDNPFVLVGAANELAREARKLKSDYACFASLPHGAGLEYIRAKALFEADSLADEPFDREHVCPWFYRNPSRYHLHRPLVKEHIRFPALNLSVDTQADLEAARALHAALGGPCNDDERLVQTARRLFSKPGLAP